MEQRIMITRWIELLLHIILLLSNILILHATEPIPQASDSLNIVNTDTSKNIRLDANLNIPDGGELLLNVQVPTETIKVNGNGPAKITSVYSDHVNGKFGVGERIDIYVSFTSNIQVIGTPMIELNTGCRDSVCHIREVQRIRCRATSGKFSLGFDGQNVVNVPYDATQKQLAEYLLRMTKIHRVFVDYNIGDTACTYFGNDITITFETVNIPGVDGDLPELTSDMNNAGGDGSKLDHLRFSVELTPKAWELRKGIRTPNRVIPFTGQVSPKIIKFSYDVQIGDNSSLLDYANTDSLELHTLANGAKIENAGTSILADITLPRPNFKGDWELGVGSSLGANSAIHIDVTPPRVITVTSTHVDGTFGIGEEILIHVTFSQPIIVTGTPTILLETGLVDRIIYFNQVVSETIVEFKYIVQPKDTSPDLTYTSPTALQLNGGAIKRKSTNPYTDAIVTLPSNGETGSLSVNKNIVIDTKTPLIEKVSAITSDGTYTAGDVINLLVKFDSPVFVTGTPLLLLNTGSVDMFPGNFVEIAPLANDPKSIIFPNVDHGLSTTESNGLQVLISGKVLTIDYVSGNKVTMIEDYTGVAVDRGMPGAPDIQIHTPGYRRARYQSGSGSASLVFTYLVQKGDVSLDLDYLSTSAMQLNSGSIKRMSTTPFTDADLTLPAPGAVGSLAAGSAIVINTNQPQIIEARAITRDGVYRVGDEIRFNLVFNLPVVVSKPASVLIRGFTPDRFALYDSGSGTNSLTFKFVCLVDDQAEIFDYVGVDSLKASYGLQLGWIRRKSSTPMTPAALTLPSTGLNSKKIAVSQTCSYIKDVTASTEDGIYGAGEEINLELKFSTNVLVDLNQGSPTVLMTTGRTAIYSRSDTDTLLFKYIVREDDVTVRLTYDNIFALELNGATINSAATGEPVRTTLPNPEMSSLYAASKIYVDTLPPRVQFVTSRAIDGVYTVGDTIGIIVKFNYRVQVTGTPNLLLNTGLSQGVSCTYVSSEDEYLYFSYSIHGSHSTGRLEYASPTALRCVHTPGINVDPTKSAYYIDSIALAQIGYVTFAEENANGKLQIRLKSFNFDRFPHLWSVVDGGGLNFDGTKDASSPSIASIGSKIYTAWQENDVNGKTQIRVAVYNDGMKAFVERPTPPTTFGINKDVSCSASAPSLASLEGTTKLYAAWHEAGTTISPHTQVRVAVFNGDDSNPSWAFVDGNEALKGVNFDSKKAARDVKLVSCGATVPVGTNNYLYAVWSEVNGNAVSQIRVAALTGTDAAPVWMIIDGKSATAGLNIDATKQATLPSADCVSGNKLTVAWQEFNVVGATMIRVKQFNGNLKSPAWSNFASTPLNYDGTKNGANAGVKGTKAGDLYVTWDEVDNAMGNSKKQIRVAKFSGDISKPSWRFLDGEKTFSNLNDVTSIDATSPTLLIVNPDKVYSFWQEPHGTNGKVQVRGSLMVESNQFFEWQSLTYDCVLRKSTTSSTRANLLLPSINSPGSLGFEKFLRIDTAVPFVKSVTFDSEKVVTSIATVEQTVDVLGKSSISQGEFQLVYGGIKSTCIDFNAAGAGEDSVENAIESISGLRLSVNVIKDATAFNDGHRYTITFVFPSKGIKLLEVVRGDGETCKAFVCNGNNVQECGKVESNANLNAPLRGGIVDIQVAFSWPVVVTTGTPKLSLETGATNQDAIYTHAGAFQEIDVGADSPSPVLGGEFRLSYGTGIGAAQTSCIPIPEFESDAVQILREKLEEIPDIKTIGIRSISRQKVKNGYRYSVSFRNSGDMLELTEADASACVPYTGRVQTIDISADSAILQGSYILQQRDSKTNCVPFNIPASGKTSLQSLVSFLTPDRLIPVQVLKDPSRFPLGTGHRYYIEFLMKADALEPINIDLLDASCEAFYCSDGNEGQKPCTGLKVVVNADFGVKKASSEKLSFRYLIQANDKSSTLTYRDTSSLSGNIFRVSMNPTIPTVLTLPSTDMIVNKITVLDLNSIPTVKRVFAKTNDGTYTTGDVVVIYVEFTVAVEVLGKPILELDSKGVAVYFSGSGLTQLEFRYKVQTGDYSAGLNYFSIYSLRTPTPVPTLGNTAKPLICRIYRVEPTGTVDANLVLPALGSANSLAGGRNVVIDTSKPTVVSVTSNRPDTPPGALGYGVGDVIDIQVQFSNDVIVSGVPSIGLNSGGTAFFTLAGYRQVIDIGVHATYPINGGQFVVYYGSKLSGCVDYNDAASTAVTSLKSRLLEIPEIQRIGLTSVTMVPVKNGNRFIVVFDSTKVLDIPLALMPTTSETCNPLVPFTSTDIMVQRGMDNTVTFHYEINEGDLSVDLNHNVAMIQLNTDGLIQRQSLIPSIAADLSLPLVLAATSLGAQKNLVVYGAPIVVLDSIADSAAGLYGVFFPPTPNPSTILPGQILFHLVFSRPVKVVGSPTIELATGSILPNGDVVPNRIAKYAGQPNSDQVAFLYTIEEGDKSNNLAFANVNALIGEIFSISTTTSAKARTTLPGRLTVSGTEIIVIDPETVSTTNRLSTSVKEGKYGVGELIPMTLDFSKEVILQRGLNRNQDANARFPHAVEMNGNIYVIWSEFVSVTASTTTSLLHMKVYKSDTLELVPSQSAPMNVVENSFVERGRLVVWQNTLYAAWDENGIIYTAKYNGLTAMPAWTMIPNTGTNRDMKNTGASDATLMVHNNVLIMFWREKGLVQNPNGKQNTLGHVGQIRFAQRNEDLDAPLWIFHDGNILNIGLNKKKEMDAKEPHGTIYQGDLYLTWAEFNGERYEIVIVRRYVLTRDQSSWKYLEKIGSVANGGEYSFFSSFRPRLAVQKQGFEDVSLLITFYRENIERNETQVVNAKIQDFFWSEKLVASDIMTTVSTRAINSKESQMAPCGSDLYGGWLEVQNGISSLRLSVLPPGSSSSWRVMTFNFNHNTAAEVLDLNLICTDSQTPSQMGIFWTEYDGISFKLHFRHQKLNKNGWGEIKDGVPYLKLETGSGTNGYAINIDQSGSKSKSLHFDYYVEAGHSSSALEILNANAFTINGATIRDIAGNVPDFILFPDENDPRSLSSTKKLEIDTTAPTVLKVTALNPSGEYGVGEKIQVLVKFSAPVSVQLDKNSLPPVIFLHADELHLINTRQTPATYVSGSGTDELLFEYITTDLDYADKLDYFNQNSLELNGKNTIKRNATYPTIDAILSLPNPKQPNSLSFNRAIRIRTNAPTILFVTSITPDGTYAPGDFISIQVKFSLPVVVYGVPRLRLNVAPNAYACYTSGNETDTINFKYEIQVDDQTSDLGLFDDRKADLTLNYVKALVLPNLAKIKRKSTFPTTDAVLILPAPGTTGSLSNNKNIVIDTRKPKIVGITSSTVDGTYDFGEVIDFQLEFSRAVHVEGKPEIVLNIPSTYPSTAIYISGSESNFLSFRYTTALGANTYDIPLDIRDTSSLILSPLQFGGEVILKPAKILCMSSNPKLEVNLTLPRPGLPLKADSILSLIGANRKIYLRTDGLRVVDMTASIPNGIYAPGHKITISVIFADSVVVQGSPRLRLNAHALLPVYASYTSGSGTKILTFDYIVQVGDTCKTLDIHSRTALDLQGGIITDTKGINVPLRLGAPNTPGSLSFNSQIEISSTPPVVESVYAVSPNGTYGVGDTLQIAIRFSKRVKISTAIGAVLPTLLLKFDAGSKVATYQSGDGMNVFIFTLQISNGDASSGLDYVDIYSLSGSLFAAATTLTVATDVKLPAPRTANSLSSNSIIQVTSSAPTVMWVEALDRNGTYGAYDNIRISVRFSYTVLVPSASVDTCVLELQVTNGRTPKAKFIGGSTTDTLVFSYQIQAGDRSGLLDYSNTNSLSCSIIQYTAQPSLLASLTLPLPGSQNSLGFRSSIQIDSSAPRVVSVSSPLSNGVYGAGQKIDISVTFSENVMVTGIPRIRLAISGETQEDAFANYFSGTGTSTLVFTYNTKEGDVSLPLEYQGPNALSLLGAASIVSSANQYRRASLRLPLSRGTGSLSNNKDILIDAAEPPRVIGIDTLNKDGIYTVGDQVDIIVKFSAPVEVHGIPQLYIETNNPTDPNSGIALYSTGSGSNQLVFQYTVRKGDSTDRLDYKRCPTAQRISPQRPTEKTVKCAAGYEPLRLAHGVTIKRLATVPTTDAILDLPDVTPWHLFRIQTSRLDQLYLNQEEQTSSLFDTEKSITPPIFNVISMSHQDASICIYSNGFPDHSSSMIIPPEKQVIKPQAYFIEIQRFPSITSNPMSTKTFAGYFGMFLNGIPFKNIEAIPKGEIVEQDQCNGAVDKDGKYFYIGYPVCFKKAELKTSKETGNLLPSPLIGYAFDGVPIYGPYDENGNKPQLDMCNGRIGFDGIYRYHLQPPSTRKTNAFMPCLRGLSDPSSNLLDLLKFPKNISAVEGLSTPMLSRREEWILDENPTQGTALWLNPAGVTVSYTSTSVIVKSNGLPDGNFGPFPNAYNSFEVKEQNYIFQFPRQPALNTKKTPLTSETAVGVMINGIPLYPTVSSVYGNVMDGKSAGFPLLDKCNGLVDAGGNYRYYGSPDCLLQELGDSANKPSPIIGFAFDGFPIYGSYNEDGVVPTDLDECNGRIGYDGTYRYHVTQEAPFTIGCFAGVVAEAPSNANDLYFRSLSYAHGLRLDTKVPRIVEVYTNKAPGSYVAGETIDLVVKWSAPVVVSIVSGKPTIPLENSFGEAIYDPSQSTAFLSVFIYEIPINALSFEFNYDSTSSIKLNGGTIKRSSTIPTLDAELELVTSEKISRFGSKHQIIQDVRIEMRGLYHQYASDLKATLYHEGRSAVIFNGCCGVYRFGEPDMIPRTNAKHLEVQTLNPSSGKGLDYHFQDFKGKNLALDGGATALQSSTSGHCYADKAIDGDVQGYLSHETVASTDKLPTSSWWQLRLLTLQEIGTLRIWMPNEEYHPAVVQRVEVDADTSVYGNFKLAFSNGREVVVTNPINYNAVAMIIDENRNIANLGIGKDESMQAKLSELTLIGRIHVSRNGPTINGGYTWSITFLDHPLVHEPLAVDTNNICDGVGSIKIAKPSLHEDKDFWFYNDTAAGNGEIGVASVSKPSMFPFWVSLYDDIASMAFETHQEAMEASIWSFRVSDPARMVSLSPPIGTKAQYVRIQTERAVPLTLAEVEVYKERNHVLSQYNGGTPIATEYHPGSEIWSPEESFREKFAYLRGEGEWVLSFKDLAHRVAGKRTDGEDSQHGDGGISDFVLHITNLAGKTKRYYMDVIAQVKTLPRHGKLYLSINQTDFDHLDSDLDGVIASMEADIYLQQHLVNFNLLNSFTRQRTLLSFLEGYVTYGGIELLSDASEREKLLPTGCNRECLEDLYMDPFFYVGTKGDVAMKRALIGKERIVRYVPQLGFKGKDAFTFTISINGQESALIGTVEVHVKDCHDPNCDRDMDVLQEVYGYIAMN